MDFMQKVFVLCCLPALFVDQSIAFHKANKLYSKLFDSRDDGLRYNKYIRPVENENSTIDVYIGLQLSQLIDVVSGYDFIHFFMHY